MIGCVSTFEEEATASHLLIPISLVCKFHCFGILGVAVGRPFLFEQVLEKILGGGFLLVKKR